MFKTKKYYKNLVGDLEDIIVENKKDIFHYTSQINDLEMIIKAKDHNIKELVGKLSGKSRNISKLEKDLKKNYEHNYILEKDISKSREMIIEMNKEMEKLKARLNGGAIKYLKGKSERK